MSILIKGMGMPTGNECLILTVYPDGQCFEHVYNGSFGSREERKAVPVPPHGRMIDADKVIATHKVGNWDLHKVLAEAPTIIEIEEDE